MVVRLGNEIRPISRRESARGNFIGMDLCVIVRGPLNFNSVSH